MEDLLRELLDKRALDEALARMMHAMDTHDWPAYRACLLADASFDFTDHGVATDEAAEIMRGADAYVAILASVIEGFDATQHSLSNMVHEITGDRAHTRCYVLAEHYLNNDRGDRNVACGARYLIDWDRTPAGWRLRHLVFKTFFFRGNPVLYELAGKRTAARIERV